MLKLSRGVIGNTSDSGSEESRFEPWLDNLNNKQLHWLFSVAAFLFAQQLPGYVFILLLLFF